MKLSAEFFRTIGKKGGAASAQSPNHYQFTPEVASKAGKSGKRSVKIDPLSKLPKLPKETLYDQTV